MNFRVGQEFQDVYLSRTITKIEDHHLYSLEGYKYSDKSVYKERRYLIVHFQRILEIHKYQEIPQKSNNFKLIFDILNGDTDTNTPGHSAS